MSEPLEAALRCAARGWPVFPCNGKRPLVEHGFHDATTDPAALEGWWRRWPKANVALRTGRTSGLLVLDVDGEAGADSLRELEREHGELPRTASVTTPRGGAHFYFRHPAGEVPSSAGQLAPGLDVRADGGYVIAPPSTGYVADEEAPVAAPAPWLLELLAPARANGQAPPVGDEIPEGERNSKLASLAGSMRRRGMGEREILAALLVANAERCRPPLPQREVEHIAASVARYQPHDGTGEARALGELDELLGLPAVGVKVARVAMFGQGAGASIDLELSNGETMSFQSIREMVRPQAMIAELVACAGATPEINQARCVQAVKRARELGERVHVDSEDADSREWGIEFLQQTETIDFNLGVQAERWRAFELLSRRNPWAHAREEGGSFASACITLRDASGSRLVRSEWFLRYVRSMVPRETPATLRTRMERVGWQRRGAEGRIKATAPGRAATLQWAFWIVPAGWAEGLS